MISLIYNGTTLTLPDGLDWTDEHSWSPVVQEANHTLSGALVVETAEKLAGRPITLESAEDRAWLPFSTVQTLRAWAAIPGAEMTLTLRGQARQVVFRHQDAPAVEAWPILFKAIYQTDDWWRVNLKFMEV